MRVITGTARGHRLKAPAHLRLRPTPARVKEALFSSLGEKIAQARVLELFAGTGAFGIECLSRGADHVLFVEKDRRAIALIEENLEKTHLAEKAEVWRMDARQALEYFERDQRKFDLVFADPPYDKGTDHGLQGTEDRGPVRQAQGKQGTEREPRRAREGGWNSFLLSSSSLSKILAPQGLLLLEHFKKNTDLQSPCFSMARQFVFGDTMVSMFRLGKQAEGL